MKVMLMGVRNFEPFETSDGNTVDGLKVFYAYSEDNVVGRITESKWITREKFGGFGLTLDDLFEAARNNLVIDVEFDSKSKIVGITL